MSSRTRRLVAACTVAAAGAVTAVAPTSAQAPPLPTLTITLTSGKAPVVDPAGLQPGQTTVVGKSAGKSRDFVLARASSESARAEIERLLGSRRGPDERQIDRLGKTLATFLVTGAAEKNRDYQATADLPAGTYYAVDITGRPRWSTFEIAGNPTGAAAPALDATVDMRDYKFTKAQRTLPAEGTLRVRNRGKQLHFMLAFPTSSSRNASRLEALLRSRSRTAERRAERYVAGPPSEPVGLISPGVENRVDVDLRPGHYVLVCFYGSPASRRQHNQRGMARKVQFR